MLTGEYILFTMTLLTVLFRTYISLFKNIFYLLVFGERRGEGEREEEKCQCDRVVASQTYPNWGLNSQPRHVP